MSHTHEFLKYIKNASRSYEFFKQNNNQMRGKYQKINGKSIKYFTP